MTHYPNRLAATGPERTPAARRPLLLVGLLALCLLPRAFLAVRAVAVCPDATLYITLAKALEAGDLRAGLHEMGWNTYPALLAVLHRAGLDWERAGKWWGVLASSLVVLPMFGCLRRQFDDRVATVGCMLYAVHANVIEWTPEVLRDPTFWFLFMLAVYFIWRAVTEIRWGLFFAAGLVAALAVLTRFEGLFLLVPLCIWSVARWRALHGSRVRLASGVVVMLAICPLLLASLNLLAWRGESWTLLRLKPLEVAWAWLARTPAPRGPAPAPTVRVPAPGHPLPAPTDPATVPTAPVAPPAETSAWVVTLPPRLRVTQLVWAFLNELERGLTVVFGIPMLVGLWRWRRLLARADHLPIVLLGLTVLGSMWIHLWFTQTRCFRYPITIVLVTSGFAGLAVLGASLGLKRLALQRGLAPRWRRAMVALPLGLIAAVGLADALTKNYQRRIETATLGRWLEAQCGVRRLLISPESSLRVAAHYAGADCVTFSESTTTAGLRQAVQGLQPDAILLSRRHIRPAKLVRVLNRVKPLGYELVPETQQPHGTEAVWVVARSECVGGAHEYVARRSP